jgi:hypothetical protein
MDTIPPEVVFHRVGMPDESVVYWLDVQARPLNPHAYFGWKTTLDHWNDDAVWGDGMEPYGLFQNVPNPFDPKTTISHVVPDGGGHVTVGVCDVSGRHVRTLADGYQSQGAQSVDWDGTDDSGAPVATGIYFYRMSAPGIKASRKMLLLK